MSNLSDKFGNLGTKGANGETWLYRVLSKRYQTSDYRQDYIMQTQGIDFGIKEPNWRREYTLDVKTNLYIEQDFYAFKIELQRENKAGWLYTSKADRIYHVNSYTGRYLYYDLNEMRYYITKRLLKSPNSFNISESNGDILLQLKFPNGKPNETPATKLFWEQFGGIKNISYINKNKL